MVDLKSDKVLKVGVVGAGRIGMVHIENLISTRNVQVVAVCTPVEQEKEWAKKTVPLATVYSSFDDMILDSEIAAVWICSPTVFHQEHLSKSLAHGKHVFCEKPLSGDKSVAWSMYELSLKYPHLKTACGFVRRFAPVYNAARKAIVEGKIGAIIAIRSQTTDNFNPTEQFKTYIKGSGGIFVDCNIHDIDIALYLLGRDAEPISAYATGTTKVYPQFAEWGDVDNAHGLVTFNDNFVLNLYSSRDNRHGHHSRTEVIGTEGSIVINGEPRGLNVDISNDQGTTMMSVEDHQVLFAEGFKREAIEFRDWVLGDKDSCTFDLKDAAKSVSIGFALQKSLRQKQLINVEL